MSIVDVLILVIVITVILTVALGIVTTVAVRLYRTRPPGDEETHEGGSWYFVRYMPTGEPGPRSRR